MPWLSVVLGLRNSTLWFGTRCLRQENRGRGPAKQAMFLTVVYDLADSSSLYSGKEGHFTSAKRASHVRPTLSSVCSTGLESTYTLILVDS